MGTAASRRRRTEETARMAMELAASRRRAAGRHPAEHQRGGSIRRKEKPGGYDYDPTQRRGRRHGGERRRDGEAGAVAEAAPRPLGSRDFSSGLPRTGRAARLRTLLLC
ncbi:hypothetical protein BDA96_03G358000 [Sorghum bicolor]|uniref:Uncharacterized protein n=2 Tax=Sorghum bicolor TaxID=4558 RepID=A0A921RHH1_SORBI|nr:hypothetical protein BDA96_03G358000 [Sorghum bicolor]OQU87735.1 hypothetical protein SORBI_3003G331750 [Sorghum bicolor]